MPSTNTISKPINELERMLDTNKDTTGKSLATFMDNLSPILGYGPFRTQIVFYNDCSGLINFKILEPRNDVALIQN